MRFMDLCEYIIVDVIAETDIEIMSGLFCSEIILNWHMKIEYWKIKN